MYATVFMLLTCIERRLEPLLDRESSGGRRLVAPRPASKLFSSDGERAQMNAWSDETVNTPNLFKVFLVGLDKWVSNDCGRDEKNKIKVKHRRIVVLQYKSNNIVQWRSG